eukprot:scaffold1992_cov187-Amphora_coffeaeformis.AAC.2
MARFFFGARKKFSLKTSNKKRRDKGEVVLPLFSFAQGRIHCHSIPLLSMSSLTLPSMGGHQEHHHPRKRESAVAAAEQIQKLVAVIQRQFSLRSSSSSSSSNIPPQPRPDDAAARALGYQLGQALMTFVTVCLDENVLKSVREEQVLEGLWCKPASSSSPPLHPSVAAALFQHIQQAYHDDQDDLIDLHWLAGWIIRLEEASLTTTSSSSSSLKSTLTHALQTYQVTLLQHYEVTAVQFLHFYQRLQASSTRLQVISLALSSLPSPELWAPLWAAASLTASTTSTTEAWAVLTTTSRALRSTMIMMDAPDTVLLGEIRNMLLGMTQALHWSLLLPTSDAPLCQAWFGELVQLGQEFRKYTRNATLDSQMFFDEMWWVSLWTETLPRLLEATGGGPMMTMRTVLLPATTSMPPTIDRPITIAMQPIHALAWASWLLSSPTTDKQLVYHFWSSLVRANLRHDTVRHLGRIVEHVLASDSHHYMVLSTEDDEALPTIASSDSRFQLVTPLLPMVPVEHAETLWQDLLEYGGDFSLSHYSPLQQSGALLCGMLLLVHNLPDGFSFLTRLIARYPHLSITLMPLVVSLLNKAAKDVNGPHLLQVLDFACQVLVLDPHCATEFWNVLLQLLQPEQSAVSLRGTLLRYFPKLCRANKRLYRRIMETLGGAVGEHNLEIRLAVAATVAELAEHDLVRDVADVIGWIQGWLSIMEPQKPMERLMVYYALESLHHLVVAEELDFDVVVKVLNKRLCPIADTDRIRSLHPVIQEALVRLLGDGECGGDDSDGDDEGEDPGPRDPTVPPQVQRAVETLLELGVKLLDSYIADSPRTDTAGEFPHYRIIHAIIEALNNYSNLALGLDEQDFRDALLGEQSPATSAILQNYRKLQRILVECMDKLPNVEQDGPNDSLVKMAQRLVKFDEDSLGSTLWQKKGKSSTTINQIQTTVKSIQSILPDVTLVEQLAGRRICMAYSIARLFCADGSSLDELRDNANTIIEADSPVLIALALQSQLTVASRLVSSNSQNPFKLLKDVESWDENYATADAMYFSLASISLYLPSELRETAASEKSIVEEVADTIIDAFRGFRFDNTDVAKICLGIVGASSLRSGSLTKCSEVVDILIDSAKGYGGEQSFGAFYALALVAQVLPLCQQGKSKEEPLAARLYYRIVSLTLEELLRCFFTSEDNSITSLLACLKTGELQSDILTSLTMMPFQSIKLDRSKADTARYLSLSCAVALPSMAPLNRHLFLAVLQLFEILEWGGGKGLALPNMLKAGRSAGILQAHETSAKYEAYSALLEERISSDEAYNLDDLLLAVSGASSESISHVLRRMVVENTELLDDEGRARSLLAALMKGVALPCFGSAPFPQAPFVVAEVSKLDIRDIVETLEEAASEDCGTKFSDMGMITLAIASSLSIARPASVDNALPTVVTAKTLSSIDQLDKSVDFAKLPSAMPGTAFFGLMAVLERNIINQSPTQLQSVPLTRVVRSFELVALPKQFSKSFLQPLLDAVDDTVTKEAWISMLVSQCHGRRPATMDGSEFIQLYHQLAASDENEWYRVLGEASSAASFVRGLEHFLPKCSQRHVAHILTNAWRHCWRNGKSLQDTFLGMCKNLLTTIQLPQKLVEVVVEILLNQVLVDLQSLPFDKVFQKERDSPSAFSNYMACIRHAPIEILDKNDFFRYGGSSGVLVDGDVLRVLFAAELSSMDTVSLQRRQQERSKIVSFLARGLKVLGDQLSREDLRHIYCALVETADSFKSKAEQLAEVFEVLLQVPPQSSAYGLEWLALFVRKTALTVHTSPAELSLAYLWCNDWRDSASLPWLAPLAVADLPIYMGQLVKEKEMASTVFHLLHRLLAHWTPPSTSRDTIHVLRQCLATCRPLKEDVLTGIVTDSLLVSTSQETKSSLAER